MLMMGQEGVVYVEVPYHQEGDTTSWKEGFWGDRMDWVVVWVGGVDIHQQKNQFHGT